MRNNDYKYVQTTRKKERLEEMVKAIISGTRIIDAKIIIDKAEELIKEIDSRYKEQK